jgi:hypothetical protein
MLLNDSFVQRQATAFAARVQREARGDHEEQVRHAYKLALAREPTSHEIELARRLIANQERAFQQVSRRITFRPDVPESIYNAYQDKLRAEDHFIGPREGWSYHRGAWSKDYEGIRTVDRVRGPFALWTGRELTHGIIQAKLILHAASSLPADFRRPCDERLAPRLRNCHRCAPTTNRRSDTAPTR